MDTNKAKAQWAGLTELRRETGSIQPVSYLFLPANEPGSPVIIFIKHLEEKPPSYAPPYES